MKNTHQTREEENIDQLIRQALNEEETSLYEDLDEQSLPEMVGGIFKGKLKWIMVLTLIMQFVFLGLSIYCLIEFLNTNDTVSTIRWGAGMFYCVISMSMIKIWHWMEMNKNATLRETKRLELQIASLAKKLK